MNRHLTNISDVASDAFVNKQLDNIADGSTYGRPLASRLNSGRPWIDFSETIHANKNLDNVGDGSTYARVTSTPATGLNTGNAVDGSGNLKLKNVNDTAAVTVEPTTNSATFAVIPEMTQTITTKGNKVLLVFTAEVWEATSNQVTGDFAFFRDGVQLSPTYSFSFFNISTFQPVAVSFIDSPSAASHTYDVRWKLGTSGSSTVLHASGTSRRFQVVELG